MAVKFHETSNEAAIATVWRKLIVIYKTGLRFDRRPEDRVTFNVPRKHCLALLALRAFERIVVVPVRTIAVLTRELRPPPANSYLPGGRVALLVRRIKLKAVILSS